MATAQYEPSLQRVPAVLGIAAVVVSFGGTVYSMFAAPWFSPFVHALSDMGARGAVTAPIFNGGLLVGGALGIGFVVSVLLDTEHPIRAAGAIFALLAMAFMALVGVFPLPSPYHGLVAIPFFICLSLALFLWGGGDYAAGRELRGLIFVLIGVLHLVSWAWWAIFPWFPPGIAIPELVGAGGFALWGGWLATEQLRELQVDRTRL